MKLGGLFSGIGGFETAWQQTGGTVAWMCEIDPACRAVLKARFPDVPIYPDIRSLDPDDVEPVDVVTGGSPCQGFSVAGLRTGLDHDESRLFTDYVRMIDGLAERGLRYALWENVPGVLSQRNGDGRHVFPDLVAALLLGLDAAVDGADDVVRQFRQRPRWNTGLAARGCRAVSWRVLDSRHFGVPQRRRRLFACVAVGRAADRRAFTVLLEPPGGSGDSAACRQEGTGVAGALMAGSDGRGWRVGADEAAANHVVPATAKCLTTGTSQRYDIDTDDMIPCVTGEHTHTLNASAGNGGSTEDGADRGVPIAPHAYGTHFGSDPRAYEEEASALTGRNGDPGIVAAPHTAAPLTSGSSRSEGVNPPGRRQEDDHNIVAYGLFKSVPSAVQEVGREEPVVASHRLVTMTGDACDVCGCDLGWHDAGMFCANGRCPLDMEGWRCDSDGARRALAVSENQRGTVAFTDDVSALTTGGGKPGQGYPATFTRYGVRRLTPVEAERLQGFPDGWTEPCGSDSGRYRALGNAVTVTVVRWILARVRRTDERDRS